MWQTMLNLPMASCFAVWNAVFVAGKLLPSRGFLVHCPSPVRYSRVSWFSISMFMGGQFNRLWGATTTIRKEIFPSAPPPAATALIFFGRGQVGLVNHRLIGNDGLVF